MAIIEKLHGMPGSWSGNKMPDGIFVTYLYTVSVFLSPFMFYKYIFTVIILIHYFSLLIGSLRPPERNLCED